MDASCKKRSRKRTCTVYTGFCGAAQQRAVRKAAGNMLRLRKAAWITEKSAVKAVDLKFEGWHHGPLGR